MVVTIVERLKALGLSEYEARIYGSLVSLHPATAYESAKRAKVPTSKVYEVLAKLTQAGLVLEVGDSEKRLYSPLDPKELIRRERLAFSDNMEGLEKGFEDLKAPRNISYLWSLQNPEEFFLRAAQLISGASKTLLLSTWEEEIPEILETFRGAMDRGVRGASVVFGSSEVQGMGKVYPHPIRDTLYNERGGRGFVLVGDGQEVLWGNFSSQGLEGVWSQNAGFVTLAEDYIKHDIYIMKLVSRYGEDMLKRFGPGFAGLRDVFFDGEDL